MEKWCALAFAVMLALTSVAQAYPNLNATTGLVATPTADVVGRAGLTGAADVIFLDDTTFNVRGVLGVTEALELGAVGVTGVDDGFGVNAKYRLPTAIGGAAWAAGITFIAANDGADGTQFYLVGTRTLSAASINAPLRGSLGLSFTDIDSESAFRPFVSAQLGISPAMELGAEFMLETEDLGDSIFSMVLRHRFNPRVIGQLGFTNASGFTGGHDHDFFLGASYEFGAI